MGLCASRPLTNDSAYSLNKLEGTDLFTCAKQAAADGLDEAVEGAIRASRPGDDEQDELEQVRLLFAWAGGLGGSCCTCRLL